MPYAQSYLCSSMPTRRLPARPDEAPSTSSRSSFPRRTNVSLHSSALRLCPVEWMSMEPRRRMCATATTDCFYFLRQKNCRVDSASSDSVKRNQTHESPFDDRYREASLLFAGRAGSGRGAADRGERAGIPTVRGRVGGDVAQVGFVGVGLEDSCASLDLSLTRSLARSVARSFARQKHGPMVVGGRRRRPALRPSVLGGRIRCDDGVYTLV